MTRTGRARVRRGGLLWAVPLLLAGFPFAPAARAADNRILAIAEDAIYGGATGLLLGGVLTLVVPAHNRDDVVRWGVVIGTFAGFGYGLYESRGTKDEFSARVRSDADARRRVRFALESRGEPETAKTIEVSGRLLPARRDQSFRLVAYPPCREIGQRPEPATGGATWRSPW